MLLNPPAIRHCGIREEPEYVVSYGTTAETANKPKGNPEVLLKS